MNVQNEWMNEINGTIGNDMNSGHVLQMVLGTVEVQQYGKVEDTRSFS